MNAVTRLKATWAAARYLKEMYDIYGDWNLVIAAYNCGTVQSIRQSAVPMAKLIIGKSTIICLKKHVAMCLPLSLPTM